MAQIKLAKYTFDNLVGDCLPKITGVNENQWTYEDEVNDNITTRTIKTNEELAITQYSFRGCGVLTVEYLKIDSNITTLESSFYNCSKLTNINTSGWDTQNVTSMSYMFSNCSKLMSLDLSNFNTEKTTNMSYMFGGCTALASLIISSFNTKKVTDMSYMFQNCASLTTLDVSSFNTETVTNMGDMFRGCKKLTTLDLSNFNVSNVTAVNSIFYDCSSLTSLNISNFNTKKATNMTAMFYNCSSLTSLDVSALSIQKSNIASMFYNCSSLTSLDVSNFNTENVSNMTALFQNCKKLTFLDLSMFSTKNVVNISNMFNGCEKLEFIDMSNFDTSKVAIKANLFRSCNNLRTLGLIYSSSDTINAITPLLSINIEKNIYYLDANISELTPTDNINFIYYKQLVMNIDEDITLRSNGNICDELDLLTGQLIQRIAEDGSILEEEIVKQVQLSGDSPKFYNGGIIQIETNEVTPTFEIQPNFTNYYEVPSLKPNTQYTLFFKGTPTKVDLGGTVIENPTTKSLITSGEIDNILWFDTSVNEVMLIEGDLTNRDVEYFTGVKSSQKIQVQLRGEGSPIFGEGGRK